MILFALRKKKKLSPMKERIQWAAQDLPCRACEAAESAQEKAFEDGQKKHHGFLLGGWTGPKKKDGFAEIEAMKHFTEAQQVMYLWT